MKKNLLLLLVATVFSLSAFAQANAIVTCSHYLRRNPVNPAELQVVVNPRNNVAYEVTNLKKLETTGPWSGGFILMIPDDDVTATMKVEINNIAPAYAATAHYEVIEKPSMSYTNPDDRKTYKILRFRFIPVGYDEANYYEAFTNLTFNVGEETPIVSFSFTNIDQATTPIQFLYETHRTAPFPDVRDDMGWWLPMITDFTYAYGEDGVAHPLPGSPPTIFQPYLDKLTIVDGSYTGDCDNGAIPPDPTDHPNFISYLVAPPYNPLPVSFGPVTATIANGQLLVHWSTLTETNNDHFIIEASKDGKTFTKLTEVKSQAANGNSNAELTYNYATPLGAATSVLGALAFLGIGLAGFSTKKKLLLAATTVAVIAFTYSCSKKDMPAADAQQKIWVRIAQVDKDGTTKYSKAVEAVRE